MLKLPFKNRNQGIYWVRYYLDNVETSRKSTVTKTEEYKHTVAQMLDNFKSEVSSYPADVQELLLYLESLLTKNRVSITQMNKATKMLDLLVEKY
jgi:uncharacterized protein YyaL (SSP411 family)